MKNRIIALLFFSLLFCSVIAQVHTTGNRNPGSINPEPEIPFDTINDFIATPGIVNAKKLVYYGENNSSNVNCFSIQILRPANLVFYFHDYSHTLGTNQKPSLGMANIILRIAQRSSVDDEDLLDYSFSTRVNRSTNELTDNRDTLAYLYPGKYTFTFAGVSGVFDPVLPSLSNSMETSALSIGKGDHSPIEIKDDSYHELYVTMSAMEVEFEPSDGEFPVIPSPMSEWHGFIGTTNRNGVSTFVSTSGDETEGMTTIEYFDDFGRSEETVSVAATPDKKDLITYQEYDGFGREGRKWLPAKSKSGSGEYQSLAACQSSAQSTNNDNEPFSFAVYEPTPLNRIVKQFGAGEQWHRNDKSVRTEYLFNGSGELSCRLFKVQNDGESLSITSTGCYPNGKLQVIKSLDEDDHATLLFKDMQDRTVLSRKILAEGDYADTYYVFDALGRIRAILPPGLSDKVQTGLVPDKLVTDYAYLYCYDDRDRVIAKKLPGVDWCHFAYDDNDHLVFSSDGEQANRGEGTIYLYDALGRECLRGICQVNAATSLRNGNPNRTVTCRFVGINGSWMGYEVKGLNRQNVLIIHVNYYDTYNFASRLNLPLQTALYGLEAPHTRGLLTGTAIFRFGTESDPQYDYSLIRYDERNRVSHTEKTNHLGGYDVEDIQLNFAGLPMVRVLEHHVENQSVQKETYRYSYDHMSRLLTQTHQLNDGSEVTLTDNQYDDLGRVMVDARSGEKRLKTTYTYNVRGWLTSLGTDETSTGFRSFAEYLYYYEEFKGNKPCWSGNISAVEWQTSSRSKNAYVYSYDNLSRLIQASYKSAAVGIDNSTSYEYDKMGNVTSLKRYGLQYDWGEYGLIDNLTYAYNGNQVVAVEDDAIGPTYEGAYHFRDGADADVEYKYDRNGNMTMDLNKDILSIQYNSLNLPRQIAYSDGKSVAYTYSASGEKLRVCYQESDSSVMKTADYCGNKIYEDNVLKQILIDGGYITFNGSTSEYHLYMRDHLGNNRMVIGISKKSATLDQTTHYYPYGGIIGNNTKGDVQRFKYNGKELDRMNGLDWYDYGARHYDAALGIWRCIDNKAESYPDVSPYVYALNNPIKNIDPDGNSVWSKVAKGAIKVGKIVAKEGFSSLKKGVTYADAFSDIIDDYNTLTSSDASGWDRVAAGLSLASEALPVSFNDGKDLWKGGQKIVGLVKSNTTEKVVEAAAETGKAVHGNSKLSTKAQHAYDIIDDSEHIVKTGISGGKTIIKNGEELSARAERQVSKWNKEAGYEKFHSVITHKEPAGEGSRVKILDYEIARADYLRKQGHLKYKIYHQKP